MVITSLYDLRTDSRINPIGIDNPAPLFSWKMKSSVIGQKQKAYDITVCKTDGSQVWNSGKTFTGKSSEIRYGGKPFEKSTRYSWTVTVWDKDDKCCTATASFETGVFGKDGFDGAEWISLPDDPLSSATSYTVDFDFNIENGCLGFCFGGKNASDILMWQLNLNKVKGRILLCPHIRTSGNWHVICDKDITDKLGMTAEEFIGKKMHFRIKVNETAIETYIGQNESVIVDTFEQERPRPLGKIGFRQYGSERASIGNLFVVGKDGETILSSDADGFTKAFICNGGRAVVENDTVRLLTDGGEAIYLGGKEHRLPAYRKSFSIKKEISSARLYSSALGVYENYVNGERVGVIMPDGSVKYHELKPGYSEMGKRKYYNTYDVTSLLREGENVLSALTGSGWWSGLIAANYGGKCAYLCKLLICYADGTSDVVVTDESWKTASESPMYVADIYNGESYDARVSLAWMKAGFDCDEWKNAEINREYSGEITSWRGSFITVRDDLERTAQSVVIYSGATGETEDNYGIINVIRRHDSTEFTLSPGEVALIDFGQNFAGHEAFTLSGKRGTVVSIEHGETLNDRYGEKSRGNDGPGGSIYNLNYRSAQALTRYTLKGEGKENHSALFTFYGFRFIEIRTTETVTFHKITAQVVTSVEEDTGRIETSNEKVNRLFSNVKWGQYSNYLSVPTDCPQRDERYGWMADTQVFVTSGCYLGNNKTFLEKFVQDIRDAQPENGAYGGVAPHGRYGNEQGGTGWADAGIIIPHTLWKMYGDTSVISEHWKSMQKYVDGYLASTEGHGPCNIWGDWVAYESNDNEIQDILAAAYYAWDASMMAEMAYAVGYYDEAEKYKKLYKDEKTYFIGHFVNKDKLMIRGEQSVCLYALYLDLLPDEQSVKAVSKQLIDNIERNGNRLQTGFLGTKIILDTLTKIGRADIAYTLLLQEQNPSWLYTVLQGGTTVWERWNSYTIEDGFAEVGMNSFNHYAYGAVVGWMFAKMAGINYKDEGFAKIMIAPIPDERMPEVRAEYESAYGMIKTDSAVTADKWIYSFELPANTSAEVHIPMRGLTGITVNGKTIKELSLENDGIHYRGYENGENLFEAVSGKFTVICENL